MHFLTSVSILSSSSTKMMPPSYSSRRLPSSVRQKNGSENTISEWSLVVLGQAEAERRHRRQQAAVDNHDAELLIEPAADDLRGAADRCGLAAAGR